jgi:hypothetical protein
MPRRKQTKRTTVKDLRTVLRMAFEHGLLGTGGACEPGPRASQIGGHPATLGDPPLIIRVTGHFRSVTPFMYAPPGYLMVVAGRLWQILEIRLAALIQVGERTHSADLRRLGVGTRQRITAVLQRID